jgi:DNA-binding SARP family transcriptional activator
MITVQLLGGACLRAGDLPLAGPPAQRHRIALLTLIAAAWPSPLSRDRAMALLWPERDLASARRLLNLAVHVLRGTLGDGVIVSTGDGLVLDASRVSCDLHALNVAIASGEHEHVVRLHTGPLLDGFHLGGAQEFTWWLEERRSEIDHAYVTALLVIAGQQRRSGDLRGLVGTCRRLVAADPYSTQHALTLVQALSAAGDYVGARHFATEHAHRLRADLDVAVDPEIIRQLAEIQARQADLARRITVALEAELPERRITAPA